MLSISDKLTLEDAVRTRNRKLSWCIEKHVAICIHETNMDYYDAARWAIREYGLNRLIMEQHLNSVFGTQGLYYLGVPSPNDTEGLR